MIDYITWVMLGAPEYIRVETLGKVYDQRLLEIQKEFVGKGYMVTDIEELDKGRRALTFYKVEGTSEYVATYRKEPTEEEKK